ncbi:MAG TPA: TorF family putative porin [Lentimicrobium sp.]|nr:TorF family putative porin [Lentimicrobium sp.]
MKRSLIPLLILIAFTVHGYSQEIALNPGVDIMSRYVWRGLNLGGSSPSIQPSLEFTAGKFTLGTWGAFSTSNDFTVQETDLYMSYNLCDAFTVGITDYFLPDELAENEHYFEFKDDSTGHVLEAAATFNGTEKIPFTFMAAVNFYGADARHANNKKQYSTYFELAYKTKVKDVECRIFIGGTATNPDKELHETGYYAESAGITNFGITGIRTVQINDKFGLPLTGSFIINPKTEKVFLVIGLSF